MSPWPMSQDLLSRHAFLDLSMITEEIECRAADAAAEWSGDLTTRGPLFCFTEHEAQQLQLRRGGKEGAFNI